LGKRKLLGQEGRERGGGNGGPPTPRHARTMLGLRKRMLGRPTGSPFWKGRGCHFKRNNSKSPLRRKVVQQTDVHREKKKREVQDSVCRRIRGAVAGGKKI